MPRIPRNLIKETNQCYHIISRTTGQEFSLGNLEKEYLLKRIKWLSSIYFVKVFTFCILSNHFHLLIQMQSGNEISNSEIEQRFRRRYGNKRTFTKNKIASYRTKWSDLSEYVKEIKQGFSVWFNRMNNRRGYFWSERFKSVVVENGAALTACMAYIDLNPVRANIADCPEDYRYCGLGYHVQSGNKDSFLCGDLPLFDAENGWTLSDYRRYVYHVGSLDRFDGKGKSKRPIPKNIADKMKQSGYQISNKNIFQYRSRYFSESVTLGSKGFVRGIYVKLRPYLRTSRKREPYRIGDIEGIYSLRRLREVRA